jgi:hypothetical protein
VQKKESELWDSVVLNAKIFKKCIAMERDGNITALENAERQRV